MRKIGVVTVGRSDFGIYLPILRRIHAAADLDLRLYVGGAHLHATNHGSADEIAAHGFSLDHRIATPAASASPHDIAQAMGRSVQGFADAYAAERPDLLVVLGDRFEMLAAVMAAVPFVIPIAHIHGGELTLGAMDDAFRHAITKCSHLHFASTAESAERIVRMGEEPWRVTTTGAPGLDNLREVDYLTWDDLAAKLDLPRQPSPILVTYHPETLRYERTGEQIDPLLAALEPLNNPLVFTAPNADTCGRIIRERIGEFVQNHPSARFVENLGTQCYFSLMRHAAAMVGNSSSGIIEAASFDLPVVNVGIRQQGRLSPQNVVHVGNARDEIVAALETVLSPKFRRSIAGRSNPYGDGHAAQRIVERLRTAALDESLVLKRFFDGPTTSPGRWDYLAAS